MTRTPRKEVAEAAALRMPADEFDRMMRGALQVPPEKPEPKGKPEKPARKPKRQRRPNP